MPSMLEPHTVHFFSFFLCIYIRFQLFSLFLFYVLFLPRPQPVCHVMHLCFSLLPMQFDLKTITGLLLTNLRELQISCTCARYVVHSVLRCRLGQRECFQLLKLDYN